MSNKAVNFRDDNDPKTILIKNDKGEPVRINFAEFKPGVHEVHSSSHRNYDGSDAGDGDATNGPATATASSDGNDTGKGKGSSKGKGKGNADDGQVYTMEIDGKFYRTDKEGTKLNPEGFDTADLAAAAPVVPA